MYGPYPYPFMMPPQQGGSTTDFEKAYRLFNKIMEKEERKKFNKAEEEKKKKEKKPEVPKISAPLAMVLAIGLSPILGPLYVIAVKHLLEVAGLKW